MLKSRFSIPLIAFFVLAIASCMLYLVNTENIFKTYVMNRHAAAVVSTESDSQNIESNHVAVQGKSELEKELDDTDPNSEKKFLTPVPDNTNETPHPGISKSGKSVTDTPALNEAKNNSGEIIAAESNHEDDAYPANDIRALWKKYSQGIPKLYSAPLTKDTEEKLGLVAQLSGELDLLYIDNKAEWRRRFGEVSNDLVMMAVAGEREGARALSFQLIRPPLNNKVDALTWALIANAIAPNEYYLYLCSENFSACTEGDFLQASAQANKYINVNGFVVKK